MPNQNMSDKRRQSRNLKTAVVLFGVVGGMVGLSFAAVPLYQLFCQVTGFGGKINLNNTLQSRLMLAYETRLPALRALLFD